MQAKNSEAMEELKKICLIHQIFPPEPSSVCVLPDPFACLMVCDLSFFSSKPPSRSVIFLQIDAEVTEWFDYLVKLKFLLLLLCTLLYWTCVCFCRQKWRWLLGVYSNTWNQSTENFYWLNSSVFVVKRVQEVLQRPLVWCDTLICLFQVNIRWNRLHESWEVEDFWFSCASISFFSCRIFKDYKITNIKFFFCFGK